MGGLGQSLHAAQAGCNLECEFRQLCAISLQQMKKKPAPKRSKPEVPDFVRRAERAMRRAARNVIKEHRALNLPIIVWENGKVVEKTV